GLAFNFQPHAAGAVDEIALLDHKLVNPIDRIDASRVMMNQITSERSRRAARRRIFTDVLADKKSRVRAGLAYFDGFPRKRITTGAAGEKIKALVNLFEQRQIHFAITQVCQ